MNKIFMTLLILISGILQINAQTDRQLIREGNRLYRNGDYAQAETAYRKALEKNANNPQATYNLACAMMKQGNKEADEMFEKAAHMDMDKTGRSAAYYNKGVMHHKNKEYGQAIDDYKNALRLNPKDEDARKNLIICKREQQQQKQQQQNKDNQNSKEDNKKKDNNKEQKDKNNNDKNKEKEENKNKQQPKDQMSKENAEQLLNAVMQKEKDTQQRLKKAMQQPSRRNLKKNW